VAWVCTHTHPQACFKCINVFAYVCVCVRVPHSELRRVTVIFVNLKGLSFGKKSRFDHVPLHNAVCAMQKVIFRFQGMIRQVLVDDKGTVLIAVFGAPPFSHMDDALRGVRAALAILEELWKLELMSAIGVTYVCNPYCTSSCHSPIGCTCACRTGQVFCGTVGSEYRREYAVVGDIVNLRYVHHTQCSASAPHADRTGMMVVLG
jgi:class 3 adenylate cyclase